MERAGLTPRAGMPSRALIRPDDCRVVSYLMKPLNDLIKKASRETSNPKGAGLHAIIIGLCHHLHELLHARLRLPVPEPSAAII